ncbi:hypothetical protein [Bacillus sp. NPDC094106]|uniref:hypothetical protein n=1 Tax=Bacillus sp. NPDC094106 TaxID=3363949 RepID=UPI003809C367
MSYIGLILVLVSNVFFASKCRVFIHEIGHAFFVFITGNQITAIKIGGNKAFFAIGKLQFLTGTGGRCEFKIVDSKKRNYMMRNLISIGGVLFTLTMAIVLIGTGYFNFIHFGNGIIEGKLSFVECLVLFCFLDLKNLIPNTFIQNNVVYQTDGYKIIQDTKSHFKQRRIIRLQKNIMKLVK